MAHSERAPPPSSERGSSFSSAEPEPDPSPMSKSLKRLLDEYWAANDPPAKTRAVETPPPKTHAVVWTPFEQQQQQPETRALDSMVLSRDTAAALAGDDEELARRATATQLRAERAMAVLERASVVQPRGSLYDSRTVLTVGHAAALENSLYRNSTPRAPPIELELRSPPREPRDRRAYFRSRKKGRWRRYSEGMRVSLIAHSTSTVDMRFGRMRDAVDKGIIKKYDTCLVNGCVRRPRALQLCRAHYQKQYRDIRRTQF